MKFEDAAKSIDPEIYERFKQAIELGRWPDGRDLTREQKEICLQMPLSHRGAVGVELSSFGAQRAYPWYKTQSNRHLNGAKGAAQIGSYRQLVVLLLSRVSYQSSPLNRAYITKVTVNPARPHIR